ncbi:MAG: inner-rane translocator [Thermomicrobiales bacterium]|jgi:branched-chain amino acid transport system permease protein|nr:inner-rane translocator [Thermomicrobiales bacterium]
MIPRNRWLAVVLVGVVTVLLVGLPLLRTNDLGSVISFLVPTLATMAILSVICIGLNVQWGYTGIFNFGVVGFFMVGAYTAAIVTKSPADGEFATYIGGFGDALAAVPLPGAAAWLPFLVAIIAAAALSAALALPLAGPIVRLREDYLAIALIGAAEVLRRIVTEEGWLVNGSRGLGGIPRPLEGWVSADAYKYLFLLLVVALLALVYVLVDRGIRSPWGRVLRAIREDEAATAAAGKDVVAFKLQGFVLGAAIMGAGGALFAFQQGAVSPDTFTHFFGTFIIWAMLIAGGSGNMVGAIVGVFVIWGLWSTTLQLQGFDLPTFIEGRIPHLRDTLVGVIIVAVLLLNPRGLVPEQARVSRWLDRRVAAMRKSESSQAASR